MKYEVKSQVKNSKNDICTEYIWVTRGTVCCEMKTIISSKIL